MARGHRRTRLSRLHLFFVISGYCIAHLVVREYRGRRDVPGFLLQRFLRIFPPYWGPCLAAAIIALVFLPFNHGAIFASPAGPDALPASLGSWLSHVFLLDAWRDRGGSLLVAWTLSWELSYYFLAALALGLGLRFGRTADLAFALTLAVAGTIPAVAAVLPPHLFSILIAIVASLVAAALFFAYVETPVERWHRSRHLRASPFSPKFPL